MLIGQKVDLEFYANRYINSPELSKILSYTEVFRINASEAKAMSYDLVNIAKLDTRTKDPDELLKAYNAKVEEINKYIQQRQADINSQLLNKAVTVLGDKILLDQSTDPMELIMSGLSILDQKNKADTEKEKANRALEEELRVTMEGIKEDVINGNKKTINDLLGSAADSFSESEEKYYLDFANFYICYNESINANFSYKNTSWISRTYCEKPVKPFNIPNLIQTKWDQCLIAAKRKNDLYIKYADDRFLTASIKFVNSAITSNNKFVGAYYFKSSIIPNSAEKYINLLIASNLDPQNKKFILEKNVAFKVFKQDFFDAILQNNVPYLQIAIQYDLEKSFSGRSDENPVLFSINCNNPDALQLLLNKEVSASKSFTNRLQNLLSLCAIKNADKCAERLIKLGVNADQKEANGQTPLFLAARYNSFQTAEILLNYNIDIDYNLNYARKNQTDSEFVTLCKIIGLRSFKGENLDLFKKVIKFYPELYKEKVESGESFLEYMITNNTGSEMLATIMEIVEKTYKNENLILIYTLKSKNAFSIQTMLQDNDIDINLADDKNSTALHYALLLEDEKIPLMILTRKPQMNIANSAGLYPVHLAIAKGKNDVARKMIESGCDLNVGDSQGDTPLHYSIKKENVPITSLLISEKADINKRNNLNKSPADVGIESKNKDIFSLFWTKNLRLIWKYGVTLQGFGPSLASLKLDYFFTPKINFELGFGITYFNPIPAGIFGGVKYYFEMGGEQSKWAPFAGVFYNGGLYDNIEVGDGVPASVWMHSAYIPIGIQYMGKRGFTFAPEIALWLGAPAQLPLSYGLSVGRHFKLPSFLKSPGRSSR
jgi:ankyrin repeat protein